MPYKYHDEVTKGRPMKHERWGFFPFCCSKGKDIKGRFGREGIPLHPASHLSLCDQGRGGGEGPRGVCDAKYAIAVKATDSAAHHNHVMGPHVALWHVGQGGLNTLTVSRPGHQTSEDELVKKVASHKADLKAKQRQWQGVEVGVCLASGLLPMVNYHLMADLLLLW